MQIPRKGLVKPLAGKGIKIVLFQLTDQLAH